MSKPKKKTSHQATSVDILAATTTLQYGKPILQSLISNLGFKIATDLIKYCVDHRKEAQAFGLLKAERIDKSKIQQFINLSYLQFEAMRQYQGHKGVDDFYKDCCKVIQGYYKPFHLELSNDDLYTEKQITGHLLGMIQWTCYILSSMYSMPDCDLMVIQINQALSRLSPEFYYNVEMAQSIPRHMRPMWGLSQNFMDAIAFYHGESTNARIEREYNLELEKVIQSGAKKPGGNDFFLSLADKNGDVKWGSQTLHFIVKGAEPRYVKIADVDGLSPVQIQNQIEEYKKLVPDTCSVQFLPNGPPKSKAK